MYIRDQIAVKKFKKKEDRDKFFSVSDAFQNNGLMEDKDGNITEFTLRDLVTTQDLTRFIPQSVEVVVREALEPNLFIIDRLFQKVNIPIGSSVQIGAIGAMEAGKVGQGGEYPEKFMDLDGGDMVALAIDKHGVKLSITQEVLDQNLFDVVGMWLRAAGRALARHKERTAAKLINSAGYDIFDNINPTNSWIGSTTGRDITGTFNGTLTVNDTFGLYAYLLQRQFSPDVLLMHPMAWKVFMTDTEMREVVLNGSTKAPNGNSANNWGTSHGKLGLRTTATGNAATSGDTIKGGSAWVQTLNPLGASFNIAPSYLPTPLEVIVTHQVPFRYGTRTAGTANETTRGALTNIIMVDSANCGILGEQKPVEMNKWEDPERDIHMMKLKESWGLSLVEQGKGIAIARNIATERNYNFENSNTVTLAEITQDSGIFPSTVSL